MFFLLVLVIVVFACWFSRWKCVICIDFDMTKTIILDKSHVYSVSRVRYFLPNNSRDLVFVFCDYGQTFCFLVLQLSIGSSITYAGFIS